MCLQMYSAQLELTASVESGIELEVNSVWYCVGFICMLFSMDIVCCMKKWTWSWITFETTIVQLVRRGIHTHTHTSDHSFEDPGYVLNLMYSSAEWFRVFKRLHLQTCVKTTTLCMCCLPGWRDRDCFRGLEGLWREDDLYVLGD